MKANFYDLFLTDLGNVFDPFRQVDVAVVVGDVVDNDHALNTMPRRW